jgi:DNA polymerase-1
MDDFFYLHDSHEGSEPNTDKLKMYEELILTNRPKLIAVDTETISLQDKTAIGIGISVDEDHSFYFPIDNGRVNGYIPWFLLQDPSVKKIFHNATFDLDVLDMVAFDCGAGDIDASNLCDTAVMARMALEPDVSLPLIAWKTNKETTGMSDIMKHYHVTTADKIPVREVALHCMQDTQLTFALYNKFYPDCDRTNCDIEWKIIELLFKISKRGIAIDQELRAKYEMIYTKEVEYLKGLCESYGFSPGSPQQVAYIMAKRGVMLPYNKKKWGSNAKTSLDTSEAALEFCSDPFAQIVLKYRHVSKALNTYLIPMGRNPRVYTQFHLDVATGRVASRDVNLQNIPNPDKERNINIRNCFIPDSGTFTDFDYSQIELRVLANLSHDKEMMRVYDNDLDIHQDTADFMGVDRKICKSVNFGMVYGATAQTLMETAKIPDLKRCEQLIDTWFKRYSGVRDWIYEQQKFGLYKGYIVTLFGRKIRMPIEEGDEESIKRKAVNYTIQGTAAEIMKRAMIKCTHLPIVLQVHDELLFDGKVDLELGLENIAAFKTPISIKEVSKWE